MGHVYIAQGTGRQRDRNRRGLLVCAFDLISIPSFELASKSEAKREVRIWSQIEGSAIQLLFLETLRVVDTLHWENSAMRFLHPTPRELPLLTLA